MPRCIIGWLYVRPMAVSTSSHTFSAAITAAVNQASPFEPATVHKLAHSMIRRPLVVPCQRSPAATASSEFDPCLESHHSRRTITTQTDSE